jgi:hypothetical protein
MPAGIKTGDVFSRQKIVDLRDAIEKLHPGIYLVLPITHADREARTIDIVRNRMEVPMGRLAAVVVACALASCAKRPPVVFGERMPTGCTKETKSERCIGWIMDRLLMTVAFRAYPDEAIRGYVEEIGLRLANASHERREWKFRIIDDDEPQAYSGFNSTIYLTRGVIGILRDEAELASVIAHEMGHTIAGHNRESVLEWDRDAAAGEMNAWRERRYARDDEIQADELAVVMLARAGYDVHAVERMLRALGAGDDDEDASDDRHPIFRERIARAVALAGRYPDGKRFLERYNDRVAKLVIGEDPTNLTVYGNVALWARSGIALDLPTDHQQALVFLGRVVVDMPGEKAFTAQLVHSSLAKDVKKDGDTHTEVRVHGDVALLVTTFQEKQLTPELVALAKKLADSARRPRPDELARLHPKYFDPTMPRPIWSN